MLSLKQFSIIFLIYSFNYCAAALPSTENCGVEYGCYRDPENCKNSDCTYIYKYQDDGDYIKFELTGKTGPTKPSWLAIAFSKDQAMGDDSTAMCKYNPGGSNSVEHYYTISTPKGVKILNQDDASVGISLPEIRVEDSFFYCNFKRKKAVTGFEFYFDLSKSYYLFAAFGELNPEPKYHSNRVISNVKIDFSKAIDTSGSAGTPVKAKAHACLMVIAWILLASNGIVFARYYKFILPSFQPCGIKFWFHIHRPFMVLALILNIIALFVILSETNWNWITSGPTVAFTHSIIGIFTIIFAVAQVILGILRPDLNSGKRNLFNHVHRIFGIFTFLLATITIFLGTFIEKMKIETVGWRILVGWVVWIVYLIIQLELIEYFHKRATKDNLATSLELKNKRVVPLVTTPTQQNYTEKTVTLMKTIVLFVHIFVSLIISIALILYISI